MSEQQAAVYVFGPFQLDASSLLLLRDGKPVSLTPKAMDTLLVLVESSGRVLQKDEILSKVWPDTFIEEATLAQNIFTIRKMLGVDANGRPYIETIPRRGYRFVAEVKKLGPDGLELGAKPAGDASQSAAAAAAQPAPITKSLAVLPFNNLSKSEEIEYFVDGITESVINSLARVPQLRVMARSTVFRYKGGDKDPIEVARELGVQTVLLGWVSQRGEHLTASMELVDVANGWHIWGKQYSLTPAYIFEIQEDILRNLRDKLQLGPDDQATKRYTSNAEAYRLYLKGRHYWNKRTVEGYQKAIGCFREAIEGDPNYALAYTGLADAYSLQCSPFYGLRQPTEIMPRARAAAEKALYLDDSLAEAHTSLAYIKLVYNWDWEAAEAGFKRALMLDPRCAHAHHWYSHYLIAVGKNQEALEENMKAQELDPHEATYNQHLAWYYVFTREYDKAIENLRESISQDPNFYPAHIILGIAYRQKEMYAEAVAEFEEARRLEDTIPALAFIGHAYGVAGEKKKARAIHDELKKKSGRQYVSAYCKAIVAIGLNEYDEAFRHLDDAYHEHSEWLMWIKVNPALDHLRHDPRFDKLLQRLGLQP
nr:TPR repeat-containing protein [uncultured bacterium]